MQKQASETGRTAGLYYRDRVLLPTLPPDHRALLRSLSGPHAGSWLAASCRYPRRGGHALAGSHASGASATTALDPPNCLRALWPVTRLRRASRLAWRPRASLPANGSARSQGQSGRACMDPSGARGSGTRRPHCPAAMAGTHDGSPRRADKPSPPGLAHLWGDSRRDRVVLRRHARFAVDGNGPAEARRCRCRRSRAARCRAAQTGSIPGTCGRRPAAPHRTWGGGGGPMEWWSTRFGARSGSGPRISSPTSRARRQAWLGTQVVEHPVGGRAAGRSRHGPRLCLADGLVDLHGRRSTAGTRARVSGRGCRQQAATLPWRFHECHHVRLFGPRRQGCLQDFDLQWHDGMMILKGMTLSRWLVRKMVEDWARCRGECHGRTWYLATEWPRCSGQYNACVMQCVDHYSLHICLLPPVKEHMID